VPAADSLAFTALDLQEIRDHWGDLLAAAMPGTPRPWAEPMLTDVEKAERDRLARDERLNRGPNTIGEHPAPLVFSALAVQLSVEAGLLEVEHRCRRRLGFGPAERAAPLRGEPSGWAYWAAVWIEDAIPAIAVFDDLAAYVQATVRGLASDVRQVIGLGEPSLNLKALCFVCGKPTLRLYSGSRPTVDAYVVCVNPECDPSTEQCGARLRGRPVWPSHELEWLAAQIKPLPRKGAESA
jgi:hypothetical protein